MESEERRSKGNSSQQEGGLRSSPAVRTPHNSNTIVRRQLDTDSHHETPRKHKDGKQEKRNNNFNNDDDSCSNAGFCGTVFGRISWRDAYYIATWGVFGAIARIYIDRVFGMDCETNGGADDFWSASNICITANGLTDRRGGALFVDLPANVLGCFLMGLLSASTKHPIPWFHTDHHLQRETSWHKGLTTGFCGCLTTFASWNTQMVVMIDGTYAENGSQIVSAVIGYALGLLTAVASFMWGRVVARMWRNASGTKDTDGDERNLQFNGINAMTSPTFDEDEEQRSDESSRRMRNGDEDDDDSSDYMQSIDQISCPSDEVAAEEDQTGSIGNDNEASSVPAAVEEVSFSSTKDEMPRLGGSILYFATLCLATGSFLGFAYGDVSGKYTFYRRMWMTCICTPFGAVLRSQLKQCLPAKKTIQWGTLTANVLGAIVSVTLEAVTQRYLIDEQANGTLVLFLWAVKVGFAGSLSTVSTFVEELVGLERLIDRHVYGILTLAVGMSFGLAIYMPIVRS